MPHDHAGGASSFCNKALFFDPECQIQIALPATYLFAHAFQAEGFAYSEILWQGDFQCTRLTGKPLPDLQADACAGKKMGSRKEKFLFFINLAARPAFECPAKSSCQIQLEVFVTPFHADFFRFRRFSRHLFALLDFTVNVFIHTAGKRVIEQILQQCLAFGLGCSRIGLRSRAGRHGIRASSMFGGACGCMRVGIVAAVGFRALLLAGLAQFFFTFPFRCLAGFLLTNLFLSCLFLPGQTLGFLPFNFPTQPFTPLGFALFPLFLRFPFPCLALGFLPFPTFFFFSFALLLLS